MIDALDGVAQLLHCDFFLVDPSLQLFFVLSQLVHRGQLLEVGGDGVQLLLDGSVFFVKLVLGGGDLRQRALQSSVLHLGGADLLLGGLALLAHSVVGLLLGRHRLLQLAHLLLQLLLLRHQVGVLAAQASESILVLSAVRLDLAVQILHLLELLLPLVLEPHLRRLLRDDRALQLGRFLALLLGQRQQVLLPAQHLCLHLLLPRLALGHLELQHR